MSSNRRSVDFSSCLISSFFILISWTSAAASTAQWNGGVGNWSTASTWTPAVVPGQGGAVAPENVVIGTSLDDVTFDVDATINSLKLGGASGLSTFEPPMFGSPALTVLQNVAISPNGSFAPPYQPGDSGFTSPLTVGGNLNNGGNFSSSNNTLIKGAFVNTGTADLITPATGPRSLFSVGGTVTNQGTLNFGEYRPTSPQPAGPAVTLGRLNNTGSLLIAPGTPVVLTSQPNGIADLGGTAWNIYSDIRNGSQSAFAHLTNADSNVVLGTSITTAPLGGTLNIGGMFELSNADLNVLGNVSASSNLILGAYHSSPGSLQVAGTFTNNGSLNTQDFGSGFSANKFMNYGDVGLYAGGSSVRELDNFGTFVSSGSFEVGTGPGTGSGYVQTQNGILRDMYTRFFYAGSASLNGTLDLVGQNGFTPNIGDTFLLIAAPNGLTGAFSTVEGSVIDGGLEKLVLNYDYAAGNVYLNVEANATPEPGTAALSLAALFGLAFWQRFRRQSRELSDRCTKH